MDEASNNRRCVLLCAAPVRQAEALLPLLRADDHIVCVDGGLGLAKALGVAPAMLVGDLDSAGDLSGLPAGVEVVRFPAQKDDTDTMLAARHALSQGFRSFLLLGALGGRPDHMLANLGVLLFLARNGAEAVAADETTQAQVLVNGTLRLAPQKGCYLSVFPIGGTARGVYERGLRYSLTDATLTFDNPCGVSNEFTDQDALIRVDDGALLILTVLHDR